MQCTRILGYQFILEIFLDRQPFVKQHNKVKMVRRDIEDGGCSMSMLMKN